MKNNRLAHLILGITLSITLITGIFSYVAPPSIFPDPSWGFQVMRSMEMGGPVNHLVSPDQDDITKNTSMFLTWWSPGQYMVPYFFKSLLHITTGQASVITIVLAELLGVLGFFYFFKKIGFTPLLSAASIAFIACQQFYFIPYSFYNGGEVLMFAFVGWFLYGCFSFKKISIPMLVFVLIAGWIGFFSKSSMMLIYASGLFCLWINISPPQKDYAVWFKNALAIGIPFIISIAGIYIFFLSKGQNPASETAGGLRVIWETFTFPLASPLLAGFSVDDIAKGLVYSPDGQIFSHFWTVVILLVLALISIILIVSIVRYVPNPQYRLLIFVFYISSVLFFSYAFVRQLAISYEGRHFRTIGLLVIPGTLYLVSRANVIFKAAFALLWLFITYTSITRVYDDYQYNRTEGARGNTKLTQAFIDQPALNYLMQLDKQERNAIFVFTSADLGLEIQHNRIITIEPVGMDVKINLEDYRFDGHAGPLHILLPSDYEENGRAKFIMKCFPGYKQFKAIRLTEDYTIFSAE